MYKKCLAQKIYTFYFFLLDALHVPLIALRWFIGVHGTDRVFNQFRLPEVNVRIKQTFIAQLRLNITIMTEATKL